MSPLDEFLEKELHKEINSLFMKQPPTPPEPRKIHWDGTDHEVKDDFKIPFWVVLIAFIILVLGITFFR